MNKKIAIVLIALVGIGLYALPQTMALFAGQHSFYNIDPSGNQIPCDKCHGDVKAELTNSGFSSLTGTGGPHVNMECEFCHRLQIGQSSGNDAFVLVQYSGKAKNLANENVNVNRYLVMNVADYEGQKYPDNITWDASKEFSDGRIIDKIPRSGPVPGVQYMPTGATAGAKFSPLFDTANLTYSDTIWTWKGSSARSTDTINNGIGTVISIPSATIYPTHEDAVNVSFKDTVPVTKDEAFTPTKVNFIAQTSATGKPIVLLDGAGSRAVNTGSRYHAASLVACMDCHGGSSPQPGHETARLGATSAEDEEFCFKCHYGTEEPAELYNGTNYSHLRTYELVAGGFGNGLTAGTAPDLGTAEVHTKFVMNQPDNLAVGAFGGRYTPASNAACIACHTHVDTEISYNRPTTLTFWANEGTNDNWTIGGYGASINPAIVISDNDGNPISTGGSLTG